MNNFSFFIFENPELYQYKEVDISMYFVKLFFQLCYFKYYEEEFITFNFLYDIFLPTIFHLMNHSKRASIDSLIDKIRFLFEILFIRYQ